MMLIVASAICLLSLVGPAYGTAGHHYLVKGKVYCDTCRVHFETRLSKPIKSAKVRLECNERIGRTDTTFISEAETDESGNYQIQVDGDHEEEVCEVMLVHSPNPDCDELTQDPFHKVAGRVNLADNGISSGERLVNPLGFLKKEALPGCPEVLRELGFTRQGDLAP